MTPGLGLCVPINLNQEPCTNAVERPAQSIYDLKHSPRRNRIDPQHLPQTAAMDLADEALQGIVGRARHDPEKMRLRSDGLQPNQTMTTQTMFTEH